MHESASFYKKKATSLENKNYFIRIQYAQKQLSLQKCKHHYAVSLLINLF